MKVCLYEFAEKHNQIQNPKRNAAKGLSEIILQQ